MNWLLFAICSWVCFGLQLGLGPHLAPGVGNVQPSFVFPLVIYVALHAPARTTLWAALVLGALTDLADLSLAHATENGSILMVLGPSAIGYLVAAQLVISVRGMVLSQNFITPIVLNLVGAFVAGLVVIAIFTLRSFYPDPITWNAAERLLAAGGSAFATGIVAIPLTLGFHLLLPWFGFANHQGSHHVGHARAFKR